MFFLKLKERDRQRERGEKRVREIDRERGRAQERPPQTIAEGGSRPASPQSVIPTREAGKKRWMSAATAGAVRKRPDQAKILPNPLQLEAQ